ncbi:MAG: type III pantothenate kinase [Balneolaceae bacterium]|nr:type III pantothenate kinase [Balneolaceae bacterium]
MSKREHDKIPGTENILFIDVGNSSIKAAFHDGLNWQVPERFGLDRAADLLDWINRHSRNFEYIIVSSVVEKATEAIKMELQTDRIRVLRIEDIPRDLLDYQTPDTLGIDRFFSCYGAVAQTRKAAVVIDAGTACTVDFMEADGVFRGGVIMPGLSMLEQGMAQYASALPQVIRKVPDRWPGRSTETSLQWGISGMLRDAFSGALERNLNKFGKFDLFYTGGNAETVRDICGVDGKIRPMLVFEGLKKFLDDYL